MLRAKSQIASPNPKKAKSIARLGTPQEMGAPMRSMLRRLARELSAEGFVKTANFVDPNVPDPLPPVADLSQVFRETVPMAQPPAPVAPPPVRARGGRRRNQQPQAEPDPVLAAHVWKERNSLHDDNDQITEQSAARKMVESMSQNNSGFIKYVADEQVHKDKSIAERNNPEFGFPVTLLKVIEKFNEYNLQLEHLTHRKVNRSFVTVDEGGHKDVGKDLSLQKVLPKDLKEVMVKHIASGKMTSGKQLTSKSKPEDYGYKSCPKCWWKGQKNQQHFVHFHDELHPQNNSTKKGGSKSPKKQESTGGNKRIHSTMKQILKAMKASNPATTVATTPT